MKKILALIFAGVMALSLVACNVETTDNSDEKTDTSSSTNGTITTTTTTITNNNNTPNAPHAHVYGKWTVVKQATCTKSGKEERKCNCGVTESRDITAKGHTWNSATCTEAASCCVCQVTNGDALGHTTDCGVCNRCGIEYYSPYQLALKELNEEYEKLQKQLIPLETSISVKESILSGTLSSLGISYLNSKSYYNNQLYSIQSQLSDKQTQYTYALMAGNQIKANQLEREIYELNNQYSICYQAIQLCEDQEEIDRLKDQYELAKYAIERDYQKKLNEINNKYN